MALSLLVVDDNRDAADALAMILRKEGFEVQTAYSGQQAIQATEASCPDVFVLDLVMPDVDGFQLASQLRSRPDCSDKTFIALSGCSEQEHLDQASKVEFDEYLTKPLKLTTLLSILSEVAQRGGTH